MSSDYINNKQLYRIAEMLYVALCTSNKLERSHHFKIWDKKKKKKKKTVLELLSWSGVSLDVLMVNRKMRFVIDVLFPPPHFSFGVGKGVGAFSCSIIFLSGTFIYRHHYYTILSHSITRRKVQRCNQKPYIEEGQTIHSNEFMINIRIRRNLFFN